MEKKDIGKPRKKSPWVTAGEYSAVAFMLPTSIIAGWLIGAWLDKVFGTKFLYFVFLLLGIVAGFLQIFQFLKRKND
jgi:F0F1-type ATP synthase assembly protein I